MFFSTLSEKQGKMLKELFIVLCINKSFTGKMYNFGILLFPSASRTKEELNTPLERVPYLCTFPHS